MRAGNCCSHCTWGRCASRWMRRVDVPGPKHNIGQDPIRTTPQTTSTATTTKDLCLTTTMTLTDDRRLLKTVIAAAAWSCRMVSSSVSRAIVFSSCPLSLSLSLPLPLSALGPPGHTQSIRLPGPFRWSVPVPRPKHNIGQDPTRTTAQTTPTATITKGLGLTTTTTLTDDRRLLRTVVATACRMVSSSVSPAIVFSSCLSLSLFLPLSALGPPGQAQSLRLPDQAVGLVQCQDPSTISARTQAERRRRRRRRPLRSAAVRP